MSLLPLLCFYCRQSLDARSITEDGNEPTQRLSAAQPANPQLAAGMLAGLGRPFLVLSSFTTSENLQEILNDC